RFPAGDEPALSPAAQRACDLSGWGHAHLDVRPASAGERSAGTARPVLPSEHGLRRSSLLPSGELFQPGRLQAGHAHAASAGNPSWAAAPGRRGDQGQDPDGRGGEDGRVPAPVHRVACPRARRTQGQRAEREQGMKQVRFLAPLPNPPSLRDFIAFEQHIAATSKKRGQPIPPEWYKAPVYYKGNHRTIIGPDEDLPWPLETTKLDYELEMACVIGRAGQDVSEQDAAGYIAGYTIMNDFSARDIQFQEMACRLGPAKGKDFATAIGPCLVTPDEIPDLNALIMIARVNGEVWSRGRFGTIHWSFPQMIAHVSRGEPIY